MMRYDRQLEGEMALLYGTPSPMTEAVASCFRVHGAQVLETDKVPDEGFDSMIGKPVDILVTFIGGVGYGFAWETEEHELRGLLDSSLIGSLSCVKAVLPGMKDRGRGAMVHVMPQYARQTVPGVSMTAAAASGMGALSRSIALEYGKFDIRSNCLLYGPGFLSGPEGQVVTGAQLLEEPVDMDEIADVALYLSGGMSRHVTGEMLAVDGGAGIIAHNQLFVRGGWFE